MAIRGLQEVEFRKILRTNLTSARAISDPRHLRGRQAKLDQIDRAFNSPGKHAFVYGDRGVGKTSLALSAAVLHQTVSRGPADPIWVSCDQSVTSFQLVRDIAKSCIPVRDLIEKRRSSEGLRLNLFGLGWEAAQAFEHGTIPPIESINDAINVLQYIRQFHSDEPIIVVDEFDQLADPVERKHFADLIKQISDRDVGVRLIMTGIGKSLMI